MPKLELALLVGEQSKEWLANLEAVVTRLEAVANVAKGSLNGTKPKSTIVKAKAEAEIDEEIVQPKKKAKQVVEDEETFDLEETEDTPEEDEDEEPISMKDVVAACRANREKAIKVLKKLKVKSVHELKPTQYKTLLNEIGA